MVKHTDPFYIAIARTIERYDRQVLAIAPEKKALGFYYTIGNSLKDLPELLLIGNFEPKAATSVLNKLSDKMVEAGRRFLNGERVPMGGEYDPQVWDTTAIAQTMFTLQVTEFFQSKEYTVQQVVLPDPKGRYPTDKRCHKRYRVPVLRPTVDLMAEAMQSTQVH
jgi:hypothetical protein